MDKEQAVRQWKFKIRCGWVEERTSEKKSGLVGEEVGAIRAVCAKTGTAPGSPGKIVIFGWEPGQNLRARFDDWFVLFVPNSNPEKLSQSLRLPRLTFFYAFFKNVTKNSKKIKVCYFSAKHVNSYVFRVADTEYDLQNPVFWNQTVKSSIFMKNCKDLKKISIVRECSEAHRFLCFWGHWYQI